MIDALSKISVYVLYWVQTTTKRFPDWVRVRIFRFHKRFVIHGQAVTGSPVRCAVFAMYPGTTTLDSNLRVIDSLLRNNFKVLVVVNQNRFSSSWIPEIIKTGSMVILRPNIGRDFGAYQAGFNYLLENNLLQSIRKLVFINDTSFVTPKTQVQFLTNFFAQDHYNCLMKHYQGYVHASSNLLVINQEILNSKSFLNFWKSYYPSNMRFHAVFKGEHALSKIIGHMYFKPATEMAHEYNGEFFADEFLQLSLWAQRSYPDLRDALEILKSNAGLGGQRELFHFALDNFQISNSLGLFLNRHYNFPLKLDLPYYLLCSRESIYERLRQGECSENEIAEVKNQLESRGSATLGNPYKRLLRRYGLLT